MSTPLPPFELGDRLRKAREKRGLTKQQMADELEVHRNTISNYESGRQTPPRWLRWAWAHVTDVEPKDLMTDDELVSEGPSTIWWRYSDWYKRPMDDAA